MSDEEEAAVGEEEEEEGEDEEEAEEGEAEEEPVPEVEPVKEEEPPPTPKKPEQDESEADEPKLRRAPPKSQKSEEKEMTEAEKAMMEAKLRHQEDVEVKMQEYEEKRRVEKEEMERELAELKEKREQRRLEIADMERQMAERAQIAEKHRREDEEAMLARKEAEKRKEEEQKRKRGAKLAGWLAGAHVQKGNPPNFVIVKSDKGDGPVGKAAQELQPQLEQKKQAKSGFLAALMRRKMDPEALLENDLRKQITNLHSHICRLEMEKYDLEKRRDRQEYDLKELHQREVQVARNKALQKGLDAEAAVESPHPPKVYVSSKFDRQTDRRSYSERRVLYESPKLDRPKAIVRGTPRPPEDWGRTENEELELIRKNLGPPKYNEEIVVEGAKPPVKFIPLKMPEKDEEVPENPPEEDDNGARKRRKTSKQAEGAASDEAQDGDENAEPRETVLQADKEEFVKEGKQDFSKATFRPKN